jgi:hypothetical protein
MTTCAVRDVSLGPPYTDSRCYMAKSHTALSKLVNICAWGKWCVLKALQGWSALMSKPNNAFANCTKSPAAPPPQISNTPMVTGTGSVYWNVRDIVYAPERSVAGRDTQPTRSEPAGEK